MAAETENDDPDDPLERLFLDQEEVDRERLSEVLSGKIGIDRETGDPYFLGEFSDLSNKQKIIIYLLYRKAAVALGKLSDDEEGVQSKEISDVTGVKYNTVRGWLPKMDHLILKDDDKSGYHIPPHSLDEAMEVIADE